jgi:hypothetical protein
LFRFKAKLQLKDNSKIFIKEYAYHWTDTSGKLICRWDTASHWPDISTFPHHKHLNSGVHESTETSFADVLEMIIKNL